MAIWTSCPAKSTGEAAAILSGYRGTPPSDLEAITHCLQRLSQLALDFSEVQELDINPMIVFEKGKGAGVIDARIIIE